jgi:phage gp36-like protein
MAHPYTTRARTERASNDAARVASLLDEDQDGAEYAGRYDDLIERAANMIDADLCVRYVVPFASVNDATPCHGIVSDLCDYAALSMLYPPISEEAKGFLAMYRGLVDRIVKRQSSVPNATEVGSDAATVGMATAGNAPIFAGADGSGVRRTFGLF